MLRCGIGLLSFLLPCVAFAQAPMSLHANYETYAAGVHVADVASGFTFGVSTYQMSLAFHTTGIVGFFFRGHQLDRVIGTWHGTKAAPSGFFGQGAWRGEDRRAEIDYEQGKPSIRRLVPPNLAEREPVPDTLQTNTIDTLSALAELIRVVETTGRCETVVHTYDGRRAVEIEARTVGEEVLEPTSRSSFSGKALRCDFSGHMLAGFKFGDDRERDSKPMRGSAWLASVTQNGSRLPVRMTFQTRWFGDATMYLTGVGPGSEIQVAGGD
jgi:hypothetical protein